MRIIAGILVLFGAVLSALAQRAFVATSTNWAQTFGFADTPNQTMACWVRMPAGNAGGSVVVVTRGLVADNHYRQIGFSTNLAVAESRAGASPSSSQTNGIFQPGIWYHVAGVFNGNSSRTVYVNGNASAESTTAVAATSIDEVFLCRVTTAVSSYFTWADVVEPAIWATNLTSAEISHLAAGGDFTKRPHPSRMRPNLLSFLPELTIQGAAVPGVRGVTGISNSPALLTVLPAPFR